MQELQVRSLDQIQNELMPIIDQIRKDKGLTSFSTWPRAGRVRESGLDLTAEVIKRYDSLKAAPPAKK